MISQNVKIINKLGLHARAAAKFVTLASKFDCDIKLCRNERCVNGKSIMGVMTLAASKDTELTINLDGHDAEQAFTALQSLIENRFDEEA